MASHARILLPPTARQTCLPQYLLSLAFTTGILPCNHAAQKQPRFGQPMSTQKRKAVLFRMWARDTSP
eukprot:1638278-Prorocentrum_lima.AAC.1